MWLIQMPQNYVNTPPSCSAGKRELKKKNMSYLTHLLFATILMPQPDAFLLENKEVLTNEDEEVLIITGGFSSQGALSSVEVL